MAQNICNICGANYEYKNGRWICPACGAYKPEELSNEEVTLLYNASQKIRLALFDDAEEQYKDIVSKYPDNPDGYWGLVLAKYGIKYEQDYDGKMIPSCYAASYESVLTDKNYLKAIELADKDNKKYYEEQANKIEKIRKEWIDKASKEEPYDIFISYKDTEKENGTERTKDSYDALELYTMLSKLGYRVFYSRESLKDKTGEKYEPYIFNALNTAHIMIVYGSKPEYIESTWIKNEWMRFYKRIKFGKKQPNALLVVYNGFNPSELPSPLSKMQNLDRSRIDFSKEIESYCKRVIKAATTVLPKIERVEVKAKQGKVGKIVKIEAVELNNKTAQKTEIVREEVEKREIGNYTVSKLTANAENELKIAEMQLSTANFDEAGKRFNTFLLKNPKNGRALTGKLLAENKSKDLDGFSSIGVQSFADWKLLEQVLLFSEKSVSGKILKSLCDEVLRSFNTGDYIRARDVYSQVSAYEDSAVTEMRKSVCDLAKGLIGKNDDTAKYFIDGYLLYEQDEDKFLSQIKNVVKASIEKSDFNFAKKYSEDWLKYENFDLSANYSALKIKYKVKTLIELFAKIESNNAYSEIDGVLHCLNEESAAACFKDICDRVNTLLSAGNSAKQVYSYIDKFFRYIFDGRAEKIKQFLIFIANKPSKEFASVFDLLLSLSDFNTEEYSLYTLRFANTALKSGDFDLADKYYDKVNELHETALSWEGKLKCRLKVKNDIEYSANIQNLTDFKIIENILSLSENDGKRYEFLSRIVGYVYFALKTSKTDAAKLVAVFENLLAYVPKDFDDKIIEWLFKFARFLKDKGEFDLAEKLYAIIVNYDAENHIAYWEMLQAKLHCKDEQSVIKQYNLISDFQEFQNALLASANNDSALRHYIDIQNKQKAWVERDKLNRKKAKKRKKLISIASIILAAVMIVAGGVFGGLSYYNSENILKYNSVDGGLSVYAGKFYKAEETLIIPQAVDGKTVTEIGANAFENHTEIKKVIIPTTVNAIRESAFSGCVNLESVEFNNISETSENTQTSANENNGISLFSAQTYSAVSYATVNNNDSIKLSVIGAKAFKGCEKLQTFELNYGLKTIDDEAFSGSGLRKVVIPETVEFVGKNAFESCNSLTAIEVGGRSEIPQNWDNDWSKGHEHKVEFSIRIVFDYNGADRIVKTEQYVVYGKTYTFPIPTKDGYTFDGWYINGVRLTDNKGVAVNVWNYTTGGTVKAAYIGNENTLFFNGNGATGGNVPSQTIRTGEKVNLNANGFTREGYTFVGWATSTKGTKVYNDGALYTMGKNSSYVLYAVWQAESNTLHFNANGGSGTMADVSIATNGVLTLPANTFVNSGYKFSGWATSPNGAKEYNDKASYTMGTNSAYTLYAVWTMDGYTISYNLNGGSVTENKKDYTVETATFTLNNPTKVGYTFIGWSGTEISGTAITVTIIKGSTGDREYTANWQANVNKIKFNANGGSGNMTPQDVETDSTVILSKNQFKRSGYAFVGWAMAANGAMQYIDNATFTAGTDSEYNLYALWLAGAYSISYYLNFGYAENPNVYTVESESFTLNNPTRAGYTFTGWSGTGISGTTKTVTVQKGSTGDREYTANWQANVNKIRFNANGGSGEMTPQDVETDSTVMLSNNQFMRSGYAFVGWATSENGEMQYIDNATFTAGKDSEYNLYAVWSLDTYSLSYNLDGGTANGNPANYNVNTATFTVNNPTRKGYTFMGWSGTDITDNSLVVTIAQGSVGNRSYTANWEVAKEMSNFEFTSSPNAFTITGVKDKTVTEIIVPDYVTEIGDDAFAMCRDLEGISLGNRITRIGSNAFYLCDKLTSITIPNSVTMIDDFAFKCCRGIKTLTIGSGVSHIGYSAFEDCQAIRSIYYKGSISSWCNIEFEDDFANPNNLLSEIYFDNQRVESLIIPNGITKIGDHQFARFNNLSNIQLSNSITSIGDNAFERCGALTRINLPEGIISIGREVFAHCDSLTSLIIPHSVTCIGDLAFAHYDGAPRYLYYKGTLAESQNLISGKQYDSGDVYWTVFSYSETKPSQSGNYWYYVNGEPCIWGYSITYNLNGGEVEGNLSSYTVYMNNFTLINPTRAGYTFTGWSGTEIIGLSKNVTIAKGSIGDREYTANWDANLNVVMLKDGANTVQITGYTDEYVRLPANTFENENHEFKGWATTQGGEVAYYDRDLYPVGSNSSYTLYAVWEEMIIIDRTGWTPISTIEELNNIRNNLNGRYYLTCDLDMYGYKWTPIGYFENTKYNSNVTDKVFRGIFDGNGFVIYNLSPKESITQKTAMSSFDSSYYTRCLGCGLFGDNAGTLKNICIYNINIDLKLNKVNNGYTYREYIYCGGVCSVNNGSIIDCYVQGNINFLSNLTMLKEDDPIPLHDRYLYSVNLSGICGQSNGSIVNCFSDISIVSNVNSTMGYVVPDTENIKSLNAENLSPWDEWYIKYACQNGTYRYQFAKWHSLVNALEQFETKSGYTFIGWSLSNGGVVKHHAGDECYIPLGMTSLTLYPVWQANTN